MTAWIKNGIRVEPVPQYAILGLVDCIFCIAVGLATRSSDLANEAVAGTFGNSLEFSDQFSRCCLETARMHEIIYLIGLIVCGDVYPGRARLALNDRGNAMVDVIASSPAGGTV